MEESMEWLKSLFSSGDFMPHGYCYLWNRELVLLHLVSDISIAVAYFSIPVTLVYFVRKRRDLPFHWMFLCFGLFIVACGSTHVMEIWTLWHATYWLSGIVKAVTAVASVPTAILLVQLVPKGLALPSPETLHQVNQALVSRTAELARMNADLAAANQALRQSEDRYRLLFDSNPHPVWVYDLQTLAFLDVNRSAVQNYGYSREEFLSKTIKDIRPEETIPALLENLSNPPADQISGLWTHRKKDGTLIAVEVTSHPILFDDRKARFVVATDVTDRKKIEEALAVQRNQLAESNAELLAANRELETFSYSVSHDLRAPLRSIDGFSLALLEDYSDKLDSNGRDSLNRVRAATQRMGALIDDLLSLARVTRAEIRVQQVDLTEVVQGIVAALQSTEAHRTAEFHIQTGLEATADPRLMHIALENLLGNAWKFTSKRECAVIEFGMTRNNGLSTFFVRDNGAGFDPAYADRLFGAFQRLHDNREFPGTGIGLATVQRIIHRHGGSIWAEGVVDKGATFYFTLRDRIKELSIREETAALG
jgi:PAS domain S-box-containing protein